MSQVLDEILKRYVDDVHGLYGSRLKAVILYGSYARGDFRPDSDIDIMILVDLPDGHIRFNIKNMRLEAACFIQGENKMRCLFFRTRQIFIQVSEN